MYQRFIIKNPLPFLWEINNMFNSLLAFFFWKAFNISGFEIFLCWKYINSSQHFSLKDFLRSLYLELLIIDAVFSLTWGAFNFFFCLLVFLFLSIFSWQTLTIQWIAGMERKSLFFLFSTSTRSRIFI